ncbi:17369_t:CDS:2, partial [Dentiscutata erythropus]
YNQICDQNLNEEVINQQVQDSTSYDTINSYSLRIPSNINSADNLKTCQSWNVNSFTQFQVNTSVPASNFESFVSVITKNLEEITNVNKTTKHNKQMCHFLFERVRTAKSAIVDIMTNKDEQNEFFTQTNFETMIKLINNVLKIKEFTMDVSNLKGLSKYIKANNTKLTFKKLVKDFDLYASILGLKIKDSQSQQSSKLLKENINYFNKNYRTLSQNNTFNALEESDKGKSKKWLENAISEQHINYYKYDEFRKFEQIGKGGFGMVYKAELNKLSLIVALKSLKVNNDSDEAFIKEASNIILFYII